MMKKVFKIIGIVLLVLLVIGIFAPKESNDNKNDEKVSNVVDNTNKVDSDEKSTAGNEEVKSEESQEEKKDKKPDSTAVEFNPADYSKEITYDDLARYPDDNMYKQVFLNGEVLQTMKSNVGTVQIRFAIDGDVDKTVIVEFDPSAFEGKGNILEGDTLNVYAVSLGTIEYKTVLGATVQAPALLSSHFELIKK